MNVKRISQDVPKYVLTLLVAIAAPVSVDSY